MLNHQQQRTYLKIFIEVSERNAKDDAKSDEPLSHSPNHSAVKPDTSAAQYTIVTITPSSTASDVCAAVARKRNLRFNDDEFELVMCDGDGQGSYERILEPMDQPWQFQQSAAKHGHLGDFHFVFRQVNEDETDIEDGSGDDSEPEIFGQMPRQPLSNGKYPAAWMEKRGKKHKAWRKRYFVLIEDELLYYKRRDVYEHNKEPIARIELVNPAAIVKILPPETIQKNNNVTTFFLFDIHTPKRVYSLRIENYNDMIFWVRALSRRNEPNELLDGLDELIADSEKLHADDDEAMMEKFSNLDSILSDDAATDAYMKYLQSIRNEEFILFWLDLKKYLSDYHISSKDTQKRFAIEIYDKYIKSGSKRELSDLKSRDRKKLKKQIESGLITRDMFDEIKNSVFEFLTRDSYKFFNSNEYFRFIVTYKNIDNQYQDTYSWLDQFEKKIKEKNKQKHQYIMSSNQSTLYHHHKHSFHPNMNTLHSPVLRTRPQSPVIKPQSGLHGITSKSWTGNSAFSGSNSSNGSHQNGPLTFNKKKYGQKSNRHIYGKSVFEDAPGRAASVK